MRKNKLLFGVAILAGLLGFIPGIQPFPQNKTVFFEIVCIVFVSIYLIKNKWILAFLVYSVISTLIIPNKFSVLALQALFCGIMFYQVLYDKYEVKHKDFILNIICVAAILQSLLMVFQYMGLWPVIMPANQWQALQIFFLKSDYKIMLLDGIAKCPIVGFMDRQNIASAFLAMCIPAFFRKKWLKAIWIPIIGLVLAKSLGGIISALIVTILWLWIIKQKQALSVTVCTILLCTCFLIQFGSQHQAFSFSGRLPAWKYRITQTIPEKFLFGHGWGQEPALFKGITEEIGIVKVSPHKYHANIWYNSHNEIISLWVELGLIGYLIVSGYFFTLIRKLQHKDKLVMLGIFSCLLASNTIWIAHSAIGLILLVYMAMAQKEIDYG